ncbi:MAG: hypothetical protein ACAH89_09480 [Rariglobus sp.]
MKNITLLRASLSLVFAIILAPFSKADVLIDFNTATDFTSNFTEGSATGGTQFSYSAAGGIGSSGALGVSGSPEYISYNTPFSGIQGADGGGYTVSLFFKASTNTAGTGGNLSLALGLVADTANSILMAGSNPGWIGMAINAVSTTAGNSTNFVLSFRSADTVGSVNSAPQSASFNLTNGNWYKFTTAFVYNSGTAKFTAVATVEDYGASGASLLSTVASYTPTTIAATTIASSANLYAELRTGNLAYAGTSAIDNLAVVSAIPEPSQAAIVVSLAALAGCLALHGRRRSD